MQGCLSKASANSNSFVVQEPSFANRQDICHHSSLQREEVLKDLPGFCLGRNRCIWERRVGISRQWID